MVGHLDGMVQYYGFCVAKAKVIVVKMFKYQKKKKNLHNVNSAKSLAINLSFNLWIITLDSSLIFIKEIYGARRCIINQPFVSCYKMSFIFI